MVFFFFFFFPLEAGDALALLQTQNFLFIRQIGPLPASENLAYWLSSCGNNQAQALLTAVGKFWVRPKAL